METKREWTTIKEYEEILFDFYNGTKKEIGDTQSVLIQIVYHCSPAV